MGWNDWPGNVKAGGTVVLLCHSLIAALLLDQEEGKKDQWHLLPQTVQTLSPPHLCRRLSHISQSQLIVMIEEEAMDTSAEDDTHSGKLQTNANL